MNQSLEVPEVKGFLASIPILANPSWSPHFLTGKSFQAKGAPLEEVLRLPAIKLIHIDTTEQVFERERDSFLRMKQRLLNDQAYLDRYVAIINGNVADSDTDKSVLVERVYTKFGYIPLYIGKVTNEQKRYRRLPSPRRIRR